MNRPQDPFLRSTGNDAADVVAAVLKDQAERAERREEPAPEPADRMPLMGALFLLLLAATVWVLLSPPAFLQPPPIPTPEPVEIEAGLRMDLWVAALSLNRFRATTGAYPATLDEALETPEDGEDIVYERTGTGYRLIGQRDTLVVVYESSEPLSALRRPAMAVVDGRERP